MEGGREGLEGGGEKEGGFPSSVALVIRWTPKGIITWLQHGRQSLTSPSSLPPPICISTEMCAHWTDDALDRYIVALQKEFNSDKKEQATHFKEFEWNSPAALRALAPSDTIHGVSITELNNYLQPRKDVNRELLAEGGFSDLSTEGFIKKGDDIRTILASDAETLAKYGETPLSLILPFVKMGIAYVAGGDRGGNGIHAR